MRDTCEPHPIKNYECISRKNNRTNSDTNAAGGVAIYRRLSSISTAKVIDVAVTDTARVIKTCGDLCLAEVTCFTADTTFKFVLGAVYIHPGSSVQDIGMLLHQALLPYVHNSQAGALKRWASHLAAPRQAHGTADVVPAVDASFLSSPPAPSSSTTNFKRPRPQEPRELPIQSSPVISKSCNLSAICTDLVLNVQNKEIYLSMPDTIIEDYDMIEPVSTTSSCAKEVLSKQDIEEWIKLSQVLLDQEKVVVIDVLPTKNIQQDATSQITSSLATSIEPSMILSASTHQPITSADVHVSDDEGLTSTVEGFIIEPSSPESVLLEMDDVNSEYDDEVDDIVSAPSEIHQDLSNDEELADEVTRSMRTMEAVMDVDHERLLSDNIKFEWQEDFSTFGGMEEFLVQPTGAVRSYDSPYDAFVDIFDKSIMTEIVTETNRYAQQIIDKAKAAGTFTKQKRMYRWRDTTVDEIYCLFAIFIYMGICQRTSLEEYWKKDSVLEMAGFRKLMSLDRYILLTKCLHFVNNKKQPAAKNVGSISSRLHKLHPIISHLNDRFQTLYVLHRHITIDESLTLFNGRPSFAQYIKMKSARQGIKSFELCESQTGYLYKFVIYTGSSPDEAEGNVEGGNSGIRGSAKGKGRDFFSDGPHVGTIAEALAGKTTQTVLKLLEGLEGKGYCVTMDKFYNSPALARYLKFRGFDCLGTVHLTRKNIPEDVKKVTRESEKGTVVARHSGDVTVLSWKDTNVVSMISTYHDDSTHKGRRADGARLRPICVHDYNMIMGGVDLKDQKLATYLMERKRGIKWYVKMFKRLLNASVHNAYVMFRGSQMTTPSVAGQNKLLKHRQVRHQIADELTRRHTPPAPVRTLTSQPSLRLDKTKEHLPIRGNPLRCRMCSLKYDITTRSVIQCSVCKVGLCVVKDDCFYEYHKLETLPLRRLKRDKPRRGHGLGRQNRRNKLTQPSPSTSKG
ncbi:PiggyBac transposable element-derived protein 4 [Eumeta japonica]|uniref:PiggyBac transposable element-derived protein 4 n=1 Tax=Eumeta variegata TaxID=151549 RepID=A0A4C1ZKR4_EUMVA|nr:PiggyBac transposable element-derived protein 4 [Eumeta japonica]